MIIYRNAVLVILAMVTCLLLLSPQISSAQSSKKSYQEWVDSLKTEAKKRGIKKAVIDDAFSHVNIERPNAKIIRYDNHQPETMQTFFSYYDRRVTEDFIDKGKRHYQKNKKFFDRLEKKYNVPGVYIVSLWGMESGYGSIKGSHNILDATATLSYTRRKDFFTQQFFTALKIMEKYDRPAEKMLGSWASAMGHMQFIPTTLYDYGRDGDGDKKIDVWENEYDAFTTAAHYLSRRGWKADFLWGREVMLPKKFNYNLATIKKRRSLSYWRKKGVKRINGKSLPSAPKLQAALLVPAGANGPKFLVYDNFYRFLNWNNSINNALTVGLLGNAIAGRPTLQSEYNVGHNALKREFVVNAQAYLNRLGYSVGKADGQFGSKSREALKRYQKAKKLPADGYLDITIYKKLKQDAEKKA